jgi:hypothetical protein
MAWFSSYNHVQRMYNKSLIRVTYRVHLLMASRLFGYAQRMKRIPADFFGANSIFQIEFSAPGAEGQSQ